MNLSQAEIDAMMSGKSAPAETGELSQAEIDAMMSGGNEAPAATGELSQAEIDAMMSGGNEASPEPPARNTADMLTPQEIDTLGEVGNICMGAVATTMYTLLDRRVEITTPEVKLYTTNEIMSMYQVPFVVVEVEYIEGILGKNLLLLKEYDAALITDVLMGGEGVVEEPVELSELHMSAINEIMNQMIGSSATALSQIINTPVNISTPISRRMTLNTGDTGVLDDDLLIVIDFDMEIENLLKSQLVQIMPYEQGRDMAAKLTTSNDQPAAAPPPSPPPAAPAPAPDAPAPAPAVPAPAPAPVMVPPPVMAQPAQFESFAPIQNTPAVAPDGLHMVYDIPVQVSVELGKTKKEISEILEFDRGTVVVLDKNAGDPVEIFVNGKMVASGEVVVIEENYGVRITRLCN